MICDYIAKLLEFPESLQVLEFADGKVRLVATRADRDGALVGHPLRDLAKHIPNVESRVVAIYRGGKGIIPDGDTVVQEGDEVFFLAARKDARTVLREMRKLDEPARKVVIAGGGNIGLDLARALEGSCQVKIIERDPQSQIDRLGAVLLDYGSVQCGFQYSTQLVPRQTMQFFGDKGRLVVEVPFNAPNDVPCRLNIYEGPGLGDVAVETIEIPVCDQYGVMGDAFAAAVQDGTPQPQNKRQLALGYDSG